MYVSYMAILHYKYCETVKQNTRVAYVCMERQPVRDVKIVNQITNKGFRIVLLYNTILITSRVLKHLWECSINYLRPFCYFIQTVQISSAPRQKPTLLLY